MKKRMIFLTIYSAMFVSLLFVVPVAAQIPSPVGWSSLPFTDPLNDVYEYTGDTPCNGQKGSYTTEIDLKRVSAVGSDLLIEFQCCPIVGSNLYQCTIYIDTDDDGDTDYFIGMNSTNGQLYLRRTNDSLFWNGTGWGLESALPYTLIGDNLTIQNLDQPLSTFASERYAVVWAYIGDAPTFYADYAPNDPDCGSEIPGFPMLVCLFSLLAIMGLIQHQRRK
jgi:hypothetical protein